MLFPNSEKLLKLSKEKLMLENDDIYQTHQVTSKRNQQWDILIYLVFTHCG